MKKICLLLAGLLLLCGCQAEPQWETVDDDVAAVSAPVQEPCAITFGVPTDATEELRSEEADRSIYVQDAGDYEIISDVIEASDLDSAVRQVSGFETKNLDLVETSRFGLPEYQFAWTSESDEGRRISRASLVEDGSYYYALIFSVREGAGTTYDDCAEAVFSSFGLYGDEEF